MADLKILSLDELFKRKMEARETFMIDTTINYVGDMNDITEPEKILLSDSLYSYKFDIRDTDPDVVLQFLYTCDCEETKGQKYDSMTCPVCNTKVKRRESSPGKLAFIVIPGDYRILTPLGLMILREIIGPGKFTNIDLKKKDRKKDKKKPKEKKDADGVKIKLPDINFLNGKLTDKDINIFDAVDYLIERHGKRDKKKLIQFFLDNKAALFTNVIPVMSSKVRFRVMSENAETPVMDIHELNTPYTNIATLVELMKQSIEEKTPRRTASQMYQLQTYMWQLYGALMETFASDKTKMLRDGIYGVRVPYTSMAVLAPLTTTFEIDSCSIPIDTYKCIFKADIKNIMLNIYKMNIIDVTRILSVDYKLNEQEKNLIVNIFKNNFEDPYVYLNRQPTIAFESTMMIKIVGISDDHILRVHPMLLDSFRGDHDGDTMCIIGLPKHIRKSFYKHLGVKANIITYDYDFNGLYLPKNDYMSLLTISMEA